MKDFFGQELVVGDMVAFNPPGYKDLTTGEVIKLTPKGVTLKYLKWKEERTTNSLGCEVVRKPCVR